MNIFLVAARASLPLCCVVLVASCVSHQGPKGVYALKPKMVAIPMDGDTAEVLIPSSGSGEFRRAVGDLRHGQWRAAQEKLKVLVAKSPSDWTLRYTLGVVLEAAGSTDAAQASYRQALTMEGVDRFCCEAGLARIEARK